MENQAPETDVSQADARLPAPSGVVARPDSGSALPATSRERGGAPGALSRCPGEEGSRTTASSGRHNSKLHSNGYR